MNTNAKRAPLPKMLSADEVVRIYEVLVCDFAQAEDPIAPSGLVHFSSSATAESPANRRSKLLKRGLIALGWVASAVALDMLYTLSGSTTFWIVLVLGLSPAFPVALISVGIVALFLSGAKKNDSDEDDPDFSGALGQ